MNWYIGHERDLLGMRGVAVNLDDIAQYVVFAHIVDLRVKWDIWNKMHINPSHTNLRNAREEVLNDLSDTIGKMETYLIYIAGGIK
jgi:hypothetical protein